MYPKRPVQIFSYNIYVYVQKSQKFCQTNFNKAKVPFRGPTSTKRQLMKALWNLVPIKMREKVEKQPQTDKISAFLSVIMV